MSRLRSLSVFGALVLFALAVLVTAPTPAGAQGVNVTLADTSAEVGAELMIPVRTADVSGKNIIGYELEITYDESVLDIKGVDISGTLTPSSPTVNTDESGKIGVFFGSTETFSGAGVLVNLEAEVVGEGTSPLSFDFFRYKNNAAQEVPSTTFDGGVTTNAEEADVGSDGQVDFGDTGVSLNFSGVSGSDAVQVARFDSSPSGTDGISESNVSRYRVVIKAGSQLDFSSTEVRFDVGSFRGISNAENVTIYTRETPGGGTFSELSTSYESGSNELVVSVNSFSEFAMASNSEPLPVEFAGFEAQRQGRTAVQLRWNTASETNNAGFAVQRTRDTEKWTKIGFVESKGAASSYQFTDRGIPYDAESVRYRLKQIDTDGTTHVGPEVTVDLGAPDRVTLKTPYPNPATGSATIRYAVPETQTVTLRVYDVLGRRVKTLVQGPRKGRFERRIETDELPSGVYLVRLRTGNTVQTKRLTVAH